MADLFLKFLGWYYSCAWCFGENSWKAKLSSLPPPINFSQWFPHQANQTLFMKIQSQMNQGKAAIPLHPKLVPGKMKLVLCTLLAKASIHFMGEEMDPSLIGKSIKEIAVCFNFIHSSILGLLIMLEYHRDHSLDIFSSICPFFLWTHPVSWL